MIKTLQKVAIEGTYLNIIKAIGMGEEKRKDIGKGGKISCV